MKNKIIKYLLPLFLIAEVILAILLHTTPPTNVYCYLSIVLATLFCTLLYQPTKKWICTQGALLFTLGADLFLVLLNTNKTLAMCLFSVAQLFYATRLAFIQTKKELTVHFITRGTVSAIAILATVLVLGNNTDALAVISLFYFANLIVNAIFATIKCKSEPLLFIGLWLFLFCDVFVGFSMLGVYLPLGNNAFLHFLASPPINMVWFFYLPSQVCLSLSTLKKEQLLKK